MSNFIGRINLMMGTCTCIGFVTYPLFGSERGWYYLYFIFSY